jgi:hypothetical protein
MENKEETKKVKDMENKKDINEMLEKFVDYYLKDSKTCDMNDGLNQFKRENGLLEEVKEEKREDGSIVITIPKGVKFKYETLS